MKKIILAIFTLTILASSCQKTETSVDPNPIEQKVTARSGDDIITFNGVEYQITNGMLNFTSFEQYENLFAVDDPNLLDEFANQVYNSTEMTSYLESIDDEEVKARIGFIGMIVNENGLIKIDDYNILLDFDTRNVFATSEGSTDDLILAKNGEVHENVYPFSMDENDVIDELVAKKTRGIFCKDRWATQKNQWTSNLPTTVYISWGVYANMQANVRYTASGIYFEMQTESYCPEWSLLLGSTITVPRNLSWTYSWRRRCGTSGSGSGSSTQTQSTGAVNNRFRVVVYGNIRALKHYSLQATITSPRSVVPNDSRSVAISD